MSTQLNDYKQRLAAHDWYYDYIDACDGSWKRGFEEYKALQRLQSELDPDFTIWNQHAPKEYQHVVS